jgi:hypothetical protein
VLRHRVEDAAVAAEATLVGQCLRDVVEIDLARVRREWIDTTAAHRLDLRARLHVPDYRSPLWAVYGRLGEKIHVSWRWHIGQRRGGTGRAMP